MNANLLVPTLGALLLCSTLELAGDWRSQDHGAAQYQSWHGGGWGSLELGASKAIAQTHPTSSALAQAQINDPAAPDMLARSSAMVQDIFVVATSVL